MEELEMQPLFKEMSYEGKTPFDIFKALIRPKDGSILLEFQEKAFIGLYPQKRLQTSSFEELRTFIAPFKGHRTVAGFVSYDAVRSLEKISNRHEESDFPDLFFQSYEIEILFDTKNKRMTFFGNPSLFEELISRLEKFSPEESKIISSFEASEFAVDCEDYAFCEKVKKAKEYIQKGDAFQIVISRTFQKKVSLSALEIYESLRKTKAPFLFFLETESFAIAGASPERLVSSERGIVEMMPIAGTRPRRSGEEDIAMEKELLNDEKELAEHMMLVDLGRNDLGKVCKPRTVEVKELKKLERYSHVMHLVSRVQGQLKAQYDVLDLLQAVFPAGTLSGAPKIRAMQIIEELEASRRGLYGGAICLIDREGNFESAIAIRTVLLKDSIATIRTGAGIVFDSDPQKEAEETRHKARSVMQAIYAAEGRGVA
jgi:anthranilate synthase component I